MGSNRINYDSRSKGKKKKLKKGRNKGFFFFVAGINVRNKKHAFEKKSLLGC